MKRNVQISPKFYPSTRTTLLSLGCISGRKGR